MRVNKDELAGILNCSLPTLSSLLKRWGDEFPVIERGTNGKPYEFDADAVIAFLTAKEDERRKAGAERDELMKQYTLPGTLQEPACGAGLKPQDILALERAQKLRRDQAKEAGFLVDKSAIRQLLNALFNRLSRRMTAAIRQVCRDANIPEAVIRTIEARFAEAQRDFVKNAKKELAADGMHDDAGPALI